MATLSIQPPPKQASSDEPEQECSDSDTTSDQPLSQECEDPAEAMELDATEQHAKLWIKIVSKRVRGVRKKGQLRMNMDRYRNCSSAEHLERGQYSGTCVSGHLSYVVA